MVRGFSFVTALAASFFIFCVSASAFQVSNSLQPVPPPTIDFAELETKGYIFYKPEDVKKILSEAGFTVMADKPTASGDGVIVTTVVGQQLFLFAFFDCFEGGCFVMRPVHIIATANNGLRATGAFVNELNANFPLGNLLATPQGDVVVRNTLVAAPECGLACLDANLGAFISAAGYAHKLLKEQQTRSIVDGGAVLPAPLRAQAMVHMDDAFLTAMRATLMASSYNIAAADGAGVDLSLATSLKVLPEFENWDAVWPALLPGLKK